MKNKNLIFRLITPLVLILFSSLIFKNILSSQNVCANSISCIKNLNLTIENDVAGIYNNQNITPPKIELSVKDIKPIVLGENTLSGEKHIYVDLDKQTLYAYQGDELFMQTFISSGKWFPTPTGDFKIWIKLRSTRMSGGNGADYYNLPNVPYVMFFDNLNIAKSRGFSLHGAYWHNNFGHPMSHGCVNMRTIDAKKLYDWVNPITTGSSTYSSQNDPGTNITIYGQAPL